jgi:hypothetical protein
MTPDRKPKVFGTLFPSYRVSCPAGAGNLSMVRGYDVEKLADIAVAEQLFGNLDHVMLGEPV